MVAPASPTAGRVRLEDRDAVLEHGDVGGLVRLLQHGLVTLEGRTHGGIVESELCEAQADHVRRDPHPVQRRNGIGGGELHARRRVEHEQNWACHTVTNTYTRPSHVYKL